MNNVTSDTSLHVVLRMFWSCSIIVRICTNTADIFTAVVHTCVSREVPAPTCMPPCPSSYAAIVATSAAIIVILSASVCLHLGLGVVDAPTAAIVDELKKLTATSSESSRHGQTDDYTTINKVRVLLYYDMMYHRQKQR